MTQKLPLKKHALMLCFLLLQTCLISMYAQTVTVNDNTPNATNVTYTFTYTTTGAIGTGTATSNVFLLQGKPTGYPDYASHTPVTALAPFVVFKVNGTEFPIDATNFGVGGSAGTAIQLSVVGASVGFTIPAGATIEVIVTGIITNPATTTGPFTFNWKTALDSGATTETFSATLSTLSLNDFKNTTSVKIYPNPFNDIVSLKIDRDSKIEVYNLIGKLVSTKNIDRGNSQLDMSQYTTGVYILKIKNETGTVYKKIIKE